MYKVAMNTFGFGFNVISSGNNQIKDSMKSYLDLFVFKDLLCSCNNKLFCSKLHKAMLLFLGLLVGANSSLLVSSINTTQINHHFTPSYLMGLTRLSFIRSTKLEQSIYI